jgi:hypothetical protein
MQKTAWSTLIWIAPALPIQSQPPCRSSWSSHTMHITHTTHLHITCHESYIHTTHIAHSHSSHITYHTLHTIRTTHSHHHIAHTHISHTEHSHLSSDSHTHTHTPTLSHSWSHPSYSLNYIHSLSLPGCLRRPQPSIPTNDKASYTTAAEHREEPSDWEVWALSQLKPLAVSHSNQSLRPLRDNLAHLQAGEHHQDSSEPQNPR